MEPPIEPRSLTRPRPAPTLRPMARRRTIPQLDLLANREDRRPDLIPTPPLARHAACARVVERIRRARTFFPELDGIPIRVGLTRAAAGFAARDEFTVWMNPSGLTLHTVAHELTHLLQNLGQVPRGEKSADLFALARHRTLVDEMPCYLRVPRSMGSAWPHRREEIERLLHRTAKDAAVQRDAGHRTYLRWFEDELADRWQRCSAPAPTSLSSAVQLGLI